MKQDPRHIAYHLLASLDARVTLDQAIDRAGQHLATLSARDINLCHAIVFGTLRHQGYLDHLIRHFSDKPFETLDPRILVLLRMAAFQISFLDRVPDFAVIDTAAQLAKEKTTRGSAGFVNAVLRQLAAGRSQVPLPDKKGQFPAFLKVSCSIPNWLGKRWLKAYGKAGTEALGRSLMEKPLLTLRVNPLKTTRNEVAGLFETEGIQSQKTRFSPLGLTLDNPGKPPAQLPGFEAGWFQIQDEAAQLAVQILNPKPEETVLDACAGLGGKTCHMAGIMKNRGSITALDTEPGKLDALNRECLRLGITMVSTRTTDIIRATVKDFTGYFDRVLVDAPCSGLGVIRRNPDTRWKRTHKDILRMAAQQKKLLNAAANLVRPGGVLVFAVCSCEPEENEAVVEAFLKRRKDFSPDTGSIARLVPAMGDPDAYTIKTFPDPGDMDGFFVARMRRMPA